MTSAIDMEHRLDVQYRQRGGVGDLIVEAGVRRLVESFRSAIMGDWTDARRACSYSLIVCTTSEVGRWLTVGSF
jgi:hypothetical protein